ncbi:MAG TPA: response regulator transcription factor [Terriglobales bacterium]|nr:response regulator transcription factor [Terriglobales bacterium]
MAGQLLAAALRRERRFKVIGCVSGWDELSPLLLHSPEVIILDADFAPQNGDLDAITRVAHDSRSAIVVLIDHDTDRDAVVRAFRAGARAVFSRAQSLPQMCKCIERVAQGQVWANVEQMGYVLEALKQAVIPRFMQRDAGSLLSSRERQIVRLLCDGLTNREIARAAGLSEHTVKNHLFRIYSKLGIESRIDLMFSALGGRPGNGQPSHMAPVLPLQAERPAEEAPAPRLNPGCDSRDNGQDPLAAYAWLVHSERSAAELTALCRALREVIGVHLTPQQREQAERFATQPWPDHFQLLLHGGLELPPLGMASGPKPPAPPKQDA